jgi:3',5'-cyclic AMP phosphodiesterase CpdA
VSRSKGDAVALHPMAATLTEKALSDNIVALARMLGYLVHRDPTWRATGADPGYPDLTLAREGKIIFVELKADKGKLTPEQMDWADAIDGTHRDSGYEMRPWYYVWRPSNWYAGEVEAVLRDE